MKKIVSRLFLLIVALVVAITVTACGRAQFTVTFETNGGSAVEPILVYYDDLIEMPESPIKVGHTFEGWYSDVNFASKFNFEKTTIKNDLTLYAKWKVNTYSITFNSNGGSEVEGIAALYGSQITEPLPPSKAGYIFNGWYTTSDCSGNPFQFTTMPAENVTLYAKWVITSFTVRFLVDGVEHHSTKVDTGSCVSALPEAPTKTGFTFAGWFLDENYSEEFTLQTKIYKETIVYGKWNINEHDVTFDVAGGTALEESTVAVKYYSKLTAPTQPTRAGYKFLGWYYEDQFVEFATFTMPDKDITLVAKWERVKHTIAFNANTGLGSMSQLEAYYDTPVALTANVFSKAGYTFAGWNTKADGTGDSYADGANFTITYTGATSTSVTLYAQWTANSYTIKFNGYESLNITAPYGSSVTAPTSPEKAGYTFAGWYSNEALTQAYKFTTMPLDGITLYAKWTANEYTIVFDGYTALNITAPYESNVVAPTAPEKVGYTFGGWYLNSECTGNAYEFSTMPLNGTTLYAKWTANEYTIVFDGYTSLNIKAPYGSNVVAPAAPTKAGYTFGGWYQNKTFAGNAYEFSTMPLNGTTLYAKWTANEYTIVFDGYTSLNITAPYESRVTAPTAPTKDGYTFGGWYSSSECTGNAYEFGTMPLNGTTLYAKWTANEYTIVFDGYTSLNITAPYGSKVTAPTAPEKAGYTFGGWYVNASFAGNAYEFSTMPLDGITLYAKWTANEYTIVFDGYESLNIKAPYESKVSAPTTPTKDGYTFGGWYLNEECTGNAYEFSTMPLNGTTLYAKWTANEYTIVFDGYTSLNITAPYESNVVAPKAPEKDGYTFDGWYVNASFAGSAYEFSKMPLNGTTLYAKWTANEYTIVFDGYTSLNITAPYESKVIAPKAPERTGYTFGGWYLNSECSGNAYEFSTMPLNGTTLYAKWDIISYKLTINLQNGEANLVYEEVDFNKSLLEFKPALNPTKEGAQFKNWYYSNGEIVDFENDTMPAEELTIYAVFDDVINIYFEGCEPVKGIEGESFTTPKAPDKIGYTFVGWYTTKEFTEGTEFNLTTIPAVDLNVYAKYVANTYTIEFVGYESLNITADYESAVEAPNAPKIAGYAFGGWYDNANCEGKAFEFDTMPLDGAKLYAKWTANEYTIVFDGYADLNIKAPYESKVTAPKTNPTKTGYTFGGWYDNENCAGEAYEFSTMPLDGTTLYAKWVINTYTLTFVQNNGEDDIVMEEIPYNSTLDKAPTAKERPGYTFVGWYGNPQLTVLIDVTKVGMPAADTTLYAKWDANEYIIEFVGYEQLNIKAKYESAVEAPKTNPTKNGYTFGGWYENSECTGNAYVFGKMPLNGTKLYAKWIANEYTITFVGYESLNITADYESAVKAPDAPEKAGYTFGGWYENSECTGNAYVFGKMPLNGTKLYAKWIAIEYTIEFVGYESLNIKAPYESAVKAPKAPEKTGYTFGGWYLNEACTGNEYVFDTMPLDGATLYAKWIAHTYTVVFDANDGSETPATKTQTGFVYGVLKALEANTFSRTGYTFAGWKLDENGSAALYQNGGEVSTLTSKDNETITLYAHWVINTYTLTFVQNNGEDDIVMENIPYASTLSEAPTPAARVGYTFAGWYGDSKLTVLIDVTKVGMPAADTTLYAKWDANKYEVSFDANTGDGSIESITFTYDDETQSLPTTGFTKEGYTLIGWDTNAGAVEPAYELGLIAPNVVATGNVTLYAIWTINVYKVTFSIDGTSYEVPLEHNHLASEALTDLEANENISASKTGYTLTWNTNSLTNITLGSTHITSDTTITAVYTVNTYQVQFVAESNVGPSVIYTLTKEYGSAVSFEECINGLVQEEILLNNLNSTAEGLIASINLYTYLNEFITKYYNDLSAISTVVKAKVDTYKNSSKGISDVKTLYNGLISVENNNLVLDILKEILVAFNTSLFEPLAMLDGVIADSATMGKLGQLHADIVPALNAYAASSKNFSDVSTLNNKIKDAKLDSALKDVLGEDGYNQAVQSVNDLKTLVAACNTGGRLDLFLSNYLNKYYSALCAINAYMNLCINTFVTSSFSANDVMMLQNTVNIQLQDHQAIIALYKNNKINGQYVPVKENHVFTGWKLGSDVEYVHTDGTVYRSGDDFIGYTPASTTAETTVKVVARFEKVATINPTDIETSEVDNNVVLTWTAVDTSLFTLQQGETLEISYTIYNVYNGVLIELATVNTNSYTFDQFGEYNIKIKAFVKVLDSNNKVVKSYVSDEPLDVKDVVVAPSGISESFEISGGGKYYQHGNIDGKPTFIFFTGNEYSFSTDSDKDGKPDFNFVFTDQMGAILPEDKLPTCITAEGHILTTNKESTGLSYFYFTNGVNKDADGNLIVYQGIVCPYVLQFSLGDDLSNFVNNKKADEEDATFLNPSTAVYKIGRFDFEDYLEGSEAVKNIYDNVLTYDKNGFVFDLNIATFGGVAVDHLPFGDYLQYTFYKYDEVGNLVSTPIPLNEMGELSSTDGSFSFTAATGRYKVVIEINELYLAPYQVGGTFDGEVKEADFAAIEFDFELVDTINVYTHDQFKTVYANLDINSHNLVGTQYVRGISLHSNIEASIASNQYYVESNYYNSATFIRGGVDNLDKNTPVNVGLHEIMAYYDRTNANDGNVYKRVTRTEVDELYQIDGNYFAINGKNLPYAHWASWGNLSSIPGYYIPNNQLYMLIYMVGGDGNDISKGNLVVNDLQFVGNTSKPSFNNSASDTTLDVMNRNAGGYSGIGVFFGSNLTVNRSVVQNTTLGIVSSMAVKDPLGDYNFVASTSTLDYTKIISCWANSIYGMSASSFNIKNSYIEDCGGAAIHLEDGYSRKVGDTYYPTPTSLTIDNNTVIKNYVSGDEGYFKANNMSAIAIMMKGQIDSILSQVETGIEGALSNAINVPTYTGLTKFTTNSGESQKFNFVFLLVPCGDNKGTANNYANTNLMNFNNGLVNHFQGFVDINTKSLSHTLLTSNGANSMAYGLLSNPNKDAGLGINDGMFILPYAIPGMGNSLIGFGINEK